MDMSMLLGILGIIVSIVVGVATYYLTEKRGRRTRWHAAKDIVLRDLSKALGEGNVPTTPVIMATIRSVLRSQNALNLEAVTLDEVADDLLRQITSDPFLDSQRRTELQAKVLELRESHLKDVQDMTGTRMPDETYGFAPSIRAFAWGLLASVISGLTISAIPKFAGILHKITPEFRDILGAMLLALIGAGGLWGLVNAVSEWRARSKK